MIHLESYKNVLFSNKCYIIQRKSFHRSAKNKSHHFQNTILTLLPPDPHFQPNINQIIAILS